MESIPPASLAHESALETLTQAYLGLTARTLHLVHPYHPSLVPVLQTCHREPTLGTPTACPATPVLKILERS